MKLRCLVESAVTISFSCYFWGRCVPERPSTVRSFSNSSHDDPSCTTTTTITHLTTTHAQQQQQQTRIVASFFCPFDTNSSLYKCLIVLTICPPSVHSSSHPTMTHAQQQQQQNQEVNREIAKTKCFQ